MTDAQIIVLATPVFLLAIAAEFVVGLRRGRNTYRLNDAIASIGLGMASRVVEVFTKGIGLGLYTLAFQQFALYPLSAKTPWVWPAALLLYDFLYYWHHRLGHRVAVLWAAHVVHHQSEDYNLSTALRQTGSGWLFGWLFYLPMAALGFPPLVMAVVALIDLLYQFWVHTEQIGRLGWFDRWFCAPSNHRVHHAVNERYLDKNFGGILIVWDRLFGSYAEESRREPCVYGTRAPLRSFNPLWANLEVYAALVRKAWHARAWADKLRIFLKPPGWQPADLAQRFPQAPFDIRSVQRFDPPLSRPAAVLALALFAVALGTTAAFLWSAHHMAPLPLAAGATLILGLLWAAGAVCEPRRSRAPSGARTA